MTFTRGDTLPPGVVELEGPYTHRMVHARGLRFHVAEAGDPSRPLILLLHGSFGGWFDYRRVIAPLAAAGHHVAALDMRGYGMSDKPPVSFGYDMRGAVGDVTGVISALGHDRAVLVGSDSGGAVAMCTAMTRPERVTALVGAPACHPADLRRTMCLHPWQFLWGLARAVGCRSPLYRLRHRMGNDWLVYRRQLLSTTDGSFHGGRVYRESLDLRVRAGRIGSVTQPIRMNNQLVTAALPAAWSDAAIDVPALLLHPLQAGWPRLTARTARRFRGPLKQVSIPRTRSLTYLEAPEAFVGELTFFLDRLPEPPTTTPRPR